MEQTTEIPIYVQLISGTVLGVALANLLSGAARFVQQPLTHKFNVLHGLWMVFILGSIMVFWWQEGLSFANVEWTFPLYMFQVAYCATYLFMVAILLPDGVPGYESHYDYFISRRHWFFGAMILSYCMDLANAMIKDGSVRTDPAYLVLNGGVVALWVLGIVFPQRWIQVAVAVIFVALTVLSMLAE